MGRYYNGDIEGKFWFAVQSSDDGEFFGAQGSEPNYIDYYVDDIDAVEEGVANCLEVLGDNKERLDKFFADRDYYNDDDIKQVWLDEYKETATNDTIQTMLRWYARLELGEKILACVKEHGECSFTAEL